MICHHFSSELSVAGIKSVIDFVSNVKFVYKSNRTKTHDRGGRVKAPNPNLLSGLRSFRGGQTTGQTNQVTMSRQMKGQ